MLKEYIKHSLKVIGKDKCNDLYIIDNEQINNATNTIIDYNKDNIILYSYCITTSCPDKIECSIHILGSSTNDTFEYQEWETVDYLDGSEITYFMTRKDVINTILQANQIITSFVRDTYYDSPINYYKYTRLPEIQEIFTKHYDIHEDCLYMGLYTNKVLGDTTYRIYIKKKEIEDGYSNQYEYIVI